MHPLHTADWIIFCGYLAVVFVVGLWFARGEQTNEDYFVGGRRMNWLAVGVSLFATAFSSISFVAYPREAAYADWQFLVAILCIPLVITPLLWFLFVPLYMRLGLVSIYEYLEIRFHRRLRRLGTLLFAGYAIGWMGSMLYAVGLILQAVLGLSDAQLNATLVGVGLFAMAYTVLGGVRAVIWTDVLQAATLGGGMLAVLYLALQQVDGGLPAVLQIGMEHQKFRMVNLEFDPYKRATLWTMLAFGAFMYLPGYTTSQATAQRYVCMRSLGEARRALLLHAVVIVLVVLLFFLVGTTLYAFYHQTGSFPELPAGKQDQILPLFVATQLQQAGLIGVLVAALFAAAMSTIDSGINSMTAVVVYDWFSGRDLGVGFSRWLTVLFGLCVIGAAMVVPYLANNVIGMITTVASTFLGLLLGLFLLGMLVPRANAGGAAVGAVAGTASLAAVVVFTALPAWWYGAFTLLPAILVGWSASYLFPPPTPQQRGALAYRVRSA